MTLASLFKVAFQVQISPSTTRDSAHEKINV